jgi:hypothetical protein
MTPLHPEAARSGPSIINYEIIKNCGELFRPGRAHAAEFPETKRNGPRPIVTIGAHGRAGRVSRNEAKWAAPDRRARSGAFPETKRMGPIPIVTAGIAERGGPGQR